jgi:AraC-like DNA-binding protein
MLLSYDIYKMQELLKSFYSLTKIRVVVFNHEFRKVAEYPESDCGLCSLIRSDPAAHRECLQCDRTACEQCKSTGRFFIYTCHAGLTESTAPIRYENTVIGYMMLGQLLVCNDAREYWPEFAKHCEKYNIDLTVLEQLYRKKRAVDVSTVFHAAQIMEACAGYLWLQRYISLKEDTLPKQIDEYITSHLDTDLSVSTLCAQFSISRSNLYQIAKTYFGKGIEQLTRELRISKAKSILISADYPISEVAAMVGYNDYNYFIKVFKKETGVTPKRFSLQNGHNSSSRPISPV